MTQSNNVWLDLDDKNASRRYKLADSGGTDPIRKYNSTLGSIKRQHKSSYERRNVLGVF